MAITAALVKELRQATGAGMMDCKNALKETAGNFEEAKTWLRKKGLATASKKSGRIASEGLIGVYTTDNYGSILEHNSETDFVARNKDFQNFVEDTTKLVIDANNDTEQLKELTYPNGEKVAERLNNLIATIGENMSLRRCRSLKVDTGVVVSYTHNGVSANLGKIGVLIALTSSGDKEKLKQFAKQLAMHIAATAPLALNEENVPSELVEKERNFIEEQVKAQGKPAHIAEKMVDGRMRKFYEEVVLLQQAFVIDNKVKISQALEKFTAELGTKVSITDFCRFELGEGIDKKEDNFAEEVNKAIQV